MMKSAPLFGMILSLLLITPFADAQQFEKATLQESATVIYL